MGHLKCKTVRCFTCCPKDGESSQTLSCPHLYKSNLIEEKISLRCRTTVLNHQKTWVILLKKLWCFYMQEAMHCQQTCPQFGQHAPLGGHYCIFKVHEPLSPRRTLGTHSHTLAQTDGYRHTVYPHKMLRYHLVRKVQFAVDTTRVQL